MRLAIVSPTYPPNPCGVGDYTRHLARELAESEDVTVLTTRKRVPRPDTGVSVREAFDYFDPKSVFELLPELERLRPDWVVVQYDPYSYGAKHAFNPYLPVMLHVLKRRLGTTRLAVVVHETFAEPSNWKRAVMTTWQRGQLWVLGRAADLLVFVVDSWAERFRSWFPHARVVHLPVGNNIPRVPVDRDTVRAELNLPRDRLIVGWLGRTVPTLNVDWLHDSIRGAEVAGSPPFVLHIGGGSDDARRVLRDVPSRVAGVLSTQDLSRHLSAMDVYFAPLAEGISSRRTSLVASLSHGLPVVAAAGPATDSLFYEENGRSLALVDAARGESFREAVARLATSAELRARLGAGATELAKRAFSWESITTRLIEELR